MSERNTHFQGFAEQIWNKLSRDGSDLSVSTKDLDITLIAQELYDFALHITGHVAATTMGDDLVLRYVPDFKE